MATREPFTSSYRRVVPPWLQRTLGGRLMASLVSQADALVDRTVDSVLLRFPGAQATVDVDALALTGRERRIRRGPGESTATYARRVQTWWDAHRTRGGPYALLGQLRAFFLDWLSVRMDVVYASGTRRWMDTAGVITRDAITWGADGSGQWARVWLFMHCPTEIPGADLTLVTPTGDRIVTPDGRSIAVPVTISLTSGLTPGEVAIFTAIPREWSAAHVPFITVVLLFGDRRLWGYPTPAPDTWGDSMLTWGEPPVVLTAE